MRSMRDLRVGQTGTVADIRLSPEAAASLVRLGLAPGTRVRCSRSSPLGDPRLYQIRGAVLAIRNRAAAGILLRDP